MKPCEVPTSMVLRGEDAIWALSTFITELEEERGKELTDKQSSALVKFAKGLMFSIEAEMKAEISEKNINEKRFATRLKRQLQHRFLPPSPPLTQHG